MKKYFLVLLGTLLFWGTSAGVSIGIHGLQHLDDITALKTWETTQDTGELGMLGLIFDRYGDAESQYLHRVVETYGVGRIYHISLSPFGHTTQEVYRGHYDKEYRRFFQDIKDLDIQVVFRTMHEMNGGRYSRSSQPGGFQMARRRIYRMARQEFSLGKDRLLFSLSFNSQDLPSLSARPTQDSEFSYCSQWRIDQGDRCPRMQDYRPGDAYVDLVGVTLYNWGSSRPDERSVWKDPITLLEENNLYKRLLRFKKPLIIDELGTTAANFQNAWTQEILKENIAYDQESKNIRLREWKQIFHQYPAIVALLYFNVDKTLAGNVLTHGEADRQLILSSYLPHYSVAPWFLLRYGDDSLNKLFVSLG